jgi:hypothetical protein
MDKKLLFALVLPEQPGGKAGGPGKQAQASKPGYEAKSRKPGKHARTRKPGRPGQRFKR